MKKIIFYVFPFLTFFLLSCGGRKTASAPNSTIVVRNDSSVTVGSESPVAKTVTDITVLYGTDRTVINNSKSNDIVYGNTPANPGSADYTVGYTVVSIPPNHKEGQIETPSIWKLEFHQDSLKHMIQKTIDRLSDADFNSLLMRAKTGQDAFIFVHGFNNSFRDAALRTAQLAQDIHLPLTPIMFSWSSNGKTANYLGDEDRVQLAVPAFKDFLKRVAQKGNYKKIHLIAHSMGNRLISIALQQLRDDTVNLKIDQIIMAAPDVYADLFKLNFADALTLKSKNVTIYTAKNDWALLASKKLHGDLRLGEIGIPPPLYAFPHIDIIDAVNEKTDFLGHDRFARSPTIIGDMDSIIKSGQTASQRKIRNKVYQAYGGYVYYSF